MQDLHSGHKQRLRQKALKNFDVLAEHEIIELVLNFGIVRQNTNPIAHDLIKKFGSASNVFNAGYDELIKVKGLGEVSACLLSLIPKLSIVAQKNNNLKKQKLKNLEHALFIFQMYFKNCDHEVFYMMCVDKNSQIISLDKIGEGNEYQINLSVKDVVKKALMHNPATVLFAHNHTNNVATPSSADLNFTQNLINAFTFSYNFPFCFVSAFFIVPVLFSVFVTFLFVRSYSYTHGGVRNADSTKHGNFYGAVNILSRAVWVFSRIICCLRISVGLRRLCGFGGALHGNIRCRLGLGFIRRVIGIPIDSRIFF